jgi:FdhD protein
MMMFQRVRCIKEENGLFEESDHPVVLEAPYALWVNGRQIMTVMTSPERIEDFVIGYLFTEGMIRSVDEVESLQIEKETIRVLTTGKIRIKGGKKTILSGCGGDASFIDKKNLPQIESDLVISPDWIHQTIRTVLDSELHRSTGGIHVVGLVSPDTVLSVAEDIGRHNALDRVIGYALRKNVDLSRTFVVISGRISSEMARKCIYSNIPVVVSRGATTSLAIEVAEIAGLSIIGFVRGSKMNIYTGPERVAGVALSL